MYKRFAVVKLWPDIKAAEDECIARIKNAADALGLSCVEVHADGTLIADKQQRVCHNNVDFVLHLHYDTPKLYDAFSFVALWNPLNFYHQWGYYRTSRNLITHDDFLSCNSDAADAHVARMIRKSGTHLPAKFRLFHSTPGIAYPASLGDGKLIYIGINWEAMGGGKSRHQDVLKKLDQTGDIRIYGPRLFQGVRVWAGYKSYVDEIPFDGVSVLREISKAGIALVLSSASHKESEIMSNRLFESVAAGALIICDENPWAKKYFGDCLLYIDTRCSTDEVVAQIQQHMKWIDANRGQALQKIARAQEIFTENFDLIKNLTDLYDGLEARKQELSAAKASCSISVDAYFIMREFSTEVLSNHLESISSQTYVGLHPYLLIDDQLTEAEFREITQQVGDKASLVRMQMRQSTLLAQLIVYRPIGAILMDVINGKAFGNALIFIAPNERIFSNHIAILAEELSRNSDINCVASAAIIKNDSAEIKDISEVIDFAHLDSARPPGYGRFMYRRESFPADLNIALPYMRGRPQAILAGESSIKQITPATVIIDVLNPFEGTTDNMDGDTEIIKTFAANALNILTGFAPKPSPLMANITVPSNIPPANVSLLGLLKFIGKNPSWIWTQIALIKREGLLQRLRVFKKVVRI